MNIELTINEAKHLLLKSMGLESQYRHDVCISNHSLEFIDVKSGLEKSPGESCGCTEGVCGGT